MSVLLELSIFPLGQGEGVSQYVSEVVKMIADSKFPYKLNAMGTVIETESLPQALSLIEKSYEILEPHSNRVYATAKFDIRKGKSDTLNQKIKSIEKHTEGFVPET